MPVTLSRRQALVATSAAGLSLLTTRCKMDPSARSEPARGEPPREGLGSRERTVERIVSAQRTTDGAGVRLNRALGGSALSMLDPFLLLDEFQSDDPNDYIAGFPEHPHRGFETVTYMIEGAMEHRDSVGNRGRLVAGSAQWMTAGRGIVHSEMPKQERGLMWGFQLWVNLPRARKMIKPRIAELYRFIHANSRAKVFLHSDGAIRELIPDLVEVGVDALNPVQFTASGMDLAELKREFGREICFWGGGVDTQGVLPRGTPQQVRDQVRRCVDTLMPGGGYIFATVHNIQADVPPENLVAMWETLAEVGVYR